MRPIGIKSLGVNKTTGLEDQLVVWQINIDAQSEKVVVVYYIQTLAPTGVVITKSENKTFERYNRPDVLFKEGEEITPAVIDDKGVEVEPAVIAVGEEVKVAGNMKFEALRTSAVGQMIEGLIQIDMDLIASPDTIETDLKQN